MVGGTDHGWLVVPTTASPRCAQTPSLFWFENDLAVVPPLCRYYRPRKYRGQEVVWEISVQVPSLACRWYRHRAGTTDLGGTDQESVLRLFQRVVSKRLV